jgi:hypothetical protein
MIELDGSSCTNSTQQACSTNVNDSGLRISGGGSTVRGLSISKWGTGIRLSTLGGNVIEGNFIGVDPAGLTAKGNHGSGVSADSDSNLIGGASPAARNVFSGNNAWGLGAGIAGSGTGNVVQGNFVGTNAAGTSSIPNDVGIQAGVNAVIGGSAVGAGNVISGNTGLGV